MQLKTLFQWFMDKVMRMFERVKNDLTMLHVLVGRLYLMAYVIICSIIDYSLGSVYYAYSSLLNLHQKLPFLN